MLQLDFDDICTKQKGHLCFWTRKVQCPFSFSEFEKGIYYFIENNTENAQNALSQTSVKNKTGICVFQTRQVKCPFGFYVHGKGHLLLVSKFIEI